MSNLTICRISIALNINFNHAQGLRDTKICIKFIFQGVWTELRSEFCFLRPLFTKYFWTNLGFREIQVFNAKFNG